MDYDDILTNYVGEFGLYQRIIFVLTSMVAIATCFTNLGIVFIAAIPEHWCHIAELSHLSTEDAMNVSIPLEMDADGEKVYSSCEMYDRDYSNITYDVGRYRNKDDTVYCKDGWEYDRTTYRSSIVTEWDLVCDDLWLRTTTVSVYMAGYMIGVIISGSCSDTLGRKKTLFVSILGMTALSIGISFSTSFIMFIVLRFCVALFAISSFTCGFVMVVELVGPKWRLHTGAMIEYFWAIGYMSLAGIAYFIRDWRKFQLAIGVPIGALLALYWVIPESPRWLYMKNRHEEADKIVRKMAKMNKKELPADFKVEIKEVKNGYIWDLFRMKQLRMRTINVCFNWCVNSLVYYGLTLNTSALSGDPYLNFFISGAVEVPAYLFVQLSPLCCGRRVPLSGTMILAGVALLATLIPQINDIDWLVTTLAMFGKFNISASFAIIYIFTAELYPTQVRNIAVASGSFAARIGGILAPYIAQLSSVSSLIPIIIFGVGSIVAGALAMFLPETKGKHLPQTLQELRDLPETKGKDLPETLQELKEQANDKEEQTQPESNGTIFTNIAYEHDSVEGRYEKY